MDAKETSRILMQLGFTETEALVYWELLRNPGGTGYGVAKALNKSQANVYSALKSLSGKGAVGFANSEIRSYQAVAPNELLPRLAKEFQQKCAVAQTALSNLTSSASEDRFYQLKNQNQAYERAEAMCARAGESVAFELFPLPFDRLRDTLAEAVGRGIGVAGVTFDPEDRLEGAMCALSIKFGRASAWPQAEAWPRDHMALVVDAREAIVALFDRETHEVLHALYTDSLYISCLLHAAIVDGIILNLEKPDILKTSVNKKLFRAIPSGFSELIARPD